MKPHSAVQVHRSGRCLHAGKGCRRLSELSKHSMQCHSKVSATGKSLAGTTANKRKTSAQISKPKKTTRMPDPDSPPATKQTGQLYFNFTGFPFPLGPGIRRPTIRKEVVKGTIWVFEQTQSLDIFNVFTPVRMTIIKLENGTLWVHAPVAPTDECIRLVRELNAPVSYIVLPTFAYEHKVFVGPFSRRFPKAKVYVTPFQWSFPLNLPPQFFGIFPAGNLENEDDKKPWSQEIEQKLLLPPSLGVGENVRFSEMAFFHRSSKTLLVTDAVIFVPEAAPEVIPKEALLDLASDGFLPKFVSGGMSREEVERIASKGAAEDTPDNLRRGWQRMVLLVLYLTPGNLLLPEDSFKAIVNKLFVGPVVERLVYSKVPNAVCDWVDSICRDWQFQRIIPAHFSAPIKASPREFKRAFTFAYEATGREQEPPPKPGFLTNLLGGGSGPITRPVDFPEADMKVLDTIDDALLRAGVVYQDAETR